MCYYGYGDNMDEIKIRPMESKDCRAIEKICIATAPFALRATKTIREITLLMYNRYYTRVLRDCFVAVNAEDTPVGYILCASDYNIYRADYAVNELSAIRRKSLIGYYFAKNELRSMEKFSAAYPAHLHIDLLPCYQGQHIGSRLMKTLATHLKSQNVKGLMLCVSPENHGAIRFYENCGFERICEKAGIVYAMKL